MSGESLPDFIQRAERFRPRLRSEEHARLLANNVILHIADVSTDVHIQERVVDRLAHDGKLVVLDDGTQELMDKCVFRDVVNSIRICLYPFGRAPVQRMDDDRRGDSDAFNKKDFSEFLKAFERVAIPKAAPTTDVPNNQSPANGNNQSGTPTPPQSTPGTYQANVEQNEEAVDDTSSHHRKHH